VNLLLIEASEDVSAPLVLRDRRARHVREVLRATVGATLRAGVIGGPVGVAEVTAITPGGDVSVRFTPTGPASVPVPIDLVLAVPRPKVLRRVVQAAAAIGVRRIDLINAWRVDKSYFGSARLGVDSLAEDLRLGAEQGATTWLPPIAVHPLFMGFLDDHAPRAEHKLCAHARGDQTIELEAAFPPGTQDDIALAIGPEGGWIQRELDTLAARGWALVSLGAPILRVEAAVVSALAQLALLRRLGVRASGS
jgi:16S rRNA (uracil1498-N3)-methyltransferase